MSSRFDDLSFLDDLELGEILADIEHQRWSGWQEYLHSKCLIQKDGSLIIPADYVKHWERQIKTPYFHLTEKEKDSDRKEVRKTLKAIKEYLASGKTE